MNDLNLPTPHLCELDRELVPLKSHKCNSSWEKFSIHKRNLSRNSCDLVNTLKSKLRLASHWIRKTNSNDSSWKPRDWQVQQIVMFISYPQYIYHQLKIKVCDWRRTCKDESRSLWMGNLPWKCKLKTFARTSRLTFFGSQVQ